jgi:amino acid adenylation domain-containing protein
MSTTTGELGTLVSGFDAQAAATPDAAALICGPERLTYGELSRRANRLAGHLRSLDPPVRPGDLVAICRDRDLDLIVALLAVLKAGGCYTLMDPEFPAARLDWMAREAGVRLIVTDRTTAPRFDGRPVHILEAAAVDRHPAEPPPVTVEPDDAACVMFTSGSTGAPKGLLTSHRAMYGTYVGQRYLDFGPHQVYLQISPVPWDAFALEVFGALLHGGACVLLPGHRVDPEMIADLVPRHGVTTLQLSASLFNVMVDDYPEIFAGVPEVITAGEAASPAHCAALLRRHPHLRLLNGYGPAESMGLTTTHDIEQVTVPVPIGRPVAGKDVYVLDDDLHPVAPGLPGELYVSGVGLAHGYVARPAATAERFLVNPYGDPGARMYRTGDLARYNEDGHLEFLGRTDSQVKVRGFRVDPHEIEAALVSLPEVSRAAVQLRADDPGEKKLVAYVVPTPGAHVDGSALRRRLAGILPEYLLPSALVPLDELPLTPNGKLDRAALPPPPATERTDVRAGRTGTEEALRRIVAEVLDMDVGQVGVDDDFFDLGGNSLLAIKMVARARQSLGEGLTLRDLYLRPTVEELAKSIG